MNSFWQWVRFNFLNNLNADKNVYNQTLRSTYSDFDVHLNDATSILIGYPIIRQLRIKNGNGKLFFILIQQDKLEIMSDFNLWT